MNKKLWLVLFVALGLGAVIKLTLQDTATSQVNPTIDRYSKYSQQECASASDAMRLLRENGLVHDIGESSGVVYVQVDDALWSGLLYDNKVNAGRVFAAYSVGRSTKVDPDPLVIIKSKFSGKQLCKYGYGLGLRCD